jgi:hypothetical protein
MIMIVYSADHLEISAQNNHSERTVRITDREHVPVEMDTQERFTQDDDETLILFIFIFSFICLFLLAMSNGKNIVKRKFLFH